MNQMPKHVYLDNAPELIKAMDELQWTKDTSTPHRPETNGVAERAVRRVKEGTSTSLLQSGLPEGCWQEAMECYCFLRCVHDQLNAGGDSSQTAFERRFGHQFKGPIIPFGAQIEYKPSQQSDIMRLHQFGKKMLSGIFIGYVQHAGGGWTGDLTIVDWQQVEQATTNSDIYTKRFKAEEVEVVFKQDAYCFPIAEGDLRLPDDTEESLIRRVGHSVYHKNKKKLHGPTHGDSAAASTDDAEPARSSTSSSTGEPSDRRAIPEDYWTMRGDLLIRHHLQLRTELFVTTDSNLPIPLKYVDVIRQTTTSLESPSEKVIDDYWNIPDHDSAGGDPKPPNRSLSEPWHGRTTFHLLRPPPPDGYEWVLGRLTKKQKSLRPPNIWPEIWSTLSPKQKEIARAEWSKEKPKLEAAQAARGFKFISENDGEHANIINDARNRLAPQEAPAMPCIRYGCYVEGDPGFSARGENYIPRPHQDHTAPKGFASCEQMAVVHLPIPINQAMKIPDAKKAVDAEWLAHHQKKTWNVNKVRPKAEVIAEAQ